MALHFTVIYNPSILTLGLVDDVSAFKFVKLSNKTLMEEIDGRGRKTT